MAASDIGARFDGIRRIGFDPVKRAKILKVRNIDLEDMRFVLNGPYLIRQSDRDGEERYMVLDFWKMWRSSSSARYETTFAM